MSFRIPVPEENLIQYDTPLAPVNLECVACRTNMISAINSPCNHAVFCIKCSREYVKSKKKKPVYCPACYTVIDAIHVIHIHYTNVEYQPISI